MKVLLTHERFPPDIAGGGEPVVLQTAQNLLRHGVDVRVLTTGPADLASFEGVSTTRLPIHRYRYNLAIRKIVAMARDVDVIQTFNYHACLPSLLAGKILGKPVVCLILALFGPVWLEMRGPILGRAVVAWERFLVTRRFSRLVFLSEYSRDIALRLGSRPERCGLIKLGIDLEKYHPAIPKEHVVLFAGKLGVRKGIYDVLAAARALPAVRFRIMGWGPMEAEVRQAAPVNVEFVKFESGPPLRDAFGRASIFLLPSKAEGFPVALLEAMASGCAIISTLPLAYAGQKVPVGDRSELAQAIAGLWADPERTASCGQQNRQLAETYTWEQYTQTLLTIYDDVRSQPLAQAGSEEDQRGQS